MRRRQSGFTLIEMMISLALAGLLIAGAFQIQSVFSVQSQRQKSVNDMQQSLRIAMQTIERSIRAGGVGMVNGKMQTSLGCGGQQRTFFRVQYYDRNYWSTAFPGAPPNNVVPAVGFAPINSNADTDPDILRVISALDDGAAVNVSADNGIGQATLISTQDLHLSFQANDVLLFDNVVPGKAVTAYGCMRQISSASTAAPSGLLWQLTVPHLASYSGTTSANQLCTNNETTCVASMTFPNVVRHFRNQTIFRIQPADPSNKLDSPKLLVASQPIGDLQQQIIWTTLAEDIEDMQIALLMDDGSVCNGNEDPTPKETYNGICDPAHASAVRITLVARSPDMPGLNGGIAQQGQLGGYENEGLSTLASDGRLRRALTSEITLRN